MKKTHNKNSIILGAGLAGLSAGYHMKATIYEKNSYHGGHAYTHNNNGFIFDEGIHVLHTNNKYVLELLKKLGANLEIRKRDAWIVSNGAMTRYPFQANTYGLPVEIVKDCLIGFIENDFKDLSKVKNYQDWIYYMFGKGIAENFMIPYSKKFWGVDPKSLTTDWVNVRHPKPTLEEVIMGSLHDQTKRFGINATYRYPKVNGFYNISLALEKASISKINYNMEVTNINPSINKIEFNNKKVISYENILSSIPLPILINLIDNVPSKVINATKKLKSNSIFSVNLAVNRPHISEKNWIYFLEKKYSFFRISFPFNQAENMCPNGTSTICAEVAYGNDNKLNISKDKLIEKVVKDLIKSNIIKQSDKIIYKNVVDIKLAYILFDQDRKKSVKIIHDFLKSINIFPFGRYGLWAYLWSDEAILSGKKIADKFR